MRSLRQRVLVIFTLAGASETALHAEGPKDLVVIPQSAQEPLVARDEKVTFKASAFFLAEWDAKHRADMQALGIPSEVILEDVKEQQTFYLFELHDGEEPPAAWTTLYRQGRNVIVPMSDAEAEQWSLQGQHAVRLWHEPHGWGRSTAQLVAYDCTNKPLISGLLDKTSQTQWMDWIEKLSGVETVDLGGTTYTIAKLGASAQLLFAESAGAASYHVYSGSLAALQAGAYDHAAAGVLCGLTDASPGDGTVSAIATLPDNSYSLVVGANGSGESVYGSATSGPIPVTLAACP